MQGSSRARARSGCASACGHCLVACWAFFCVFLVSTAQPTPDVDPRMLTRTCFPLGSNNTHAWCPSARTGGVACNFAAMAATSERISC